MTASTPPIPTTSMVAVLEEYGRPLVLREVPVAPPEPGAILVKVEMAGICGTDVHQQRGDLSIQQPLPNVQGHETIGRIVALGAGRSMDAAGHTLAVGDRVVWPHAACGQCYFCQIAEEPILCNHRSGYGMAAPELLRGGFAEYEQVTPLTPVVKIPDELLDEEVVGVGCAFRSVVAGFERLGQVDFQSTVVIQGAGPVGLYSLVMARESGAGRVIVIGAPQGRLDLARSWGADHVIDIDEVKDPAERRALVLELTEGRGPELVVECSGYPPAFREGIELLQKAGRYLVLGTTSPVEISFVPNLIVGKALTVVGSNGATIRHFYKALECIRNRRHEYPFADIVTTHFSLEQVNEALASMASGAEVKPVIDNRTRGST